MATIYTKEQLKSMKKMQDPVTGQLFDAPVSLYQTPAVAPTAPTVPSVSGTQAPLGSAAKTNELLGGQYFSPTTGSQIKPFAPSVDASTKDLTIGGKEPPTPPEVIEPTLSINEEMAAKQKELQTSIQTQLEQARTEKASAQAKIDEFNVKQAGVLEEQKTTLPEALKLGFEESKQKELYVTQNFEENQKLVNELDTLLSEGNTLIKQQKEQTGLSAIRNPRVDQTISDVNARTGVIQAVINARNGQISQAYTMIDRVVDEAKNYRTDQLNYYTNLYNFYQGQKDTEGKKLIQLTSDEKGYIDSKINLLNNELTQQQAVANKIKEAMADPATATIYANAGVSLNDSLESINKKLSDYAYTKEVTDKSNELSLDGYKQLIPGQAVPAGYKSSIITDSKGNTKTWIKKAEIKEVKAPTVIGSAEAGYLQWDSSTGQFKPVAGTGGGLPSGEKLISMASEGFESAKGEDGYVSPEAWSNLRTTWLNQGGKLKDFDDNFSLYKNPKKKYK